jgi:hypothetical protein
VEPPPRRVGDDQRRARRLRRARRPAGPGRLRAGGKPGERLIARASYRSADRPRLLIWKRSKAGGWSFWREGPRLPPSHGFRRATLALPRVPRGVAALSVGIALSGDGRLAVRRLGLTARP